jgi:signal transduction histidine kinase/integral membrane sensor domain MASE1
VPSVRRWGGRLAPSHMRRAEAAPVRGRAVFWVAATALGVCAAYYVGARIGFILRFPPATPSVLWPPNAILTAALLLAPARRWWIYLIAALPAHVLVELQAGLTWPLVLALFVTNSSEALLAAIGVRRFSDAPTRFDTLRRVAVFVVAAGFAAPFLSSFLDAAAVAGLRGEQYWVVWRTRFFSNVLTQLTLVPTLVMVVTAGWDWLRDAPLSRRIEAALLAMGLTAFGGLVFAGTLDGPLAIPGSPRTPLAFLLPFLLWAAVRFGPGGVSLSLLTSAILATWAGTSTVGQGPFTSLPPPEGVLALQVFLTAVAVPLMCLAGVVEERRRAQEALQERLRFEELLVCLSSAFVHLPHHAMDDMLQTWVRQLGEFLGLDRVMLLRFSDDGQELLAGAGWGAPGFEHRPWRIVTADFPWSMRRLRDEEPVIFASLDDLPAEAAIDRASFRQREIRSSVTIPLAAGNRILGGLSFITVAAERIWPRELVPRLKLVAQVFASALARKEAEDNRQRAELEAERSRQELAHFTRVSTMGELTASLAHELNQPLTGILTNAQAARRFLDASPPDLVEVRSILADIIEDDRRAGDVIQRLRELLRKGEPRPCRLDLNAVIRDVAKLMASDALIRNVTVVLDLGPDPLVVSGDRVQLQQVILNLLLNAMEAMAEGSGGVRTVLLRAEVAAGGAVLATVRDTGTGLREGTEELIFEPFYTTKSGGMGMGLSIARSIVEAHGGRIGAVRNPRRGATIHLSLPRAGESLAAARQA